jgi:hypothetical protein
MGAEERHRLAMDGTAVNERYGVRTLTGGRLDRADP